MIRYITSGESHGKCLTSIIDGIPANVSLNIDEINLEMKKRQSGYGRGGRMKIESDTVDILSGVRGKTTIGGPIAIQINNKDYENWIKYMNPVEDIDRETIKV
ncbi:MAG: chorismate synthase, partial [Peptostreptococcaceae bacterium]|nr:chorismate synthase [Peptostreptococcaceae bacterium]